MLMVGTSAIWDLKWIQIWVYRIISYIESAGLSFFCVNVTTVLQKRAKLDYSRGGAIIKIIMDKYPYIEIK